MSTSDTIFKRIAWLCSRREYCSRGVLDLLRRKGVGERDANEILSRLRQQRYVDDARYAGSFARDKALLAGWGPKKIAYELSAKGIPEDIVRSALDSVDEDGSLRRMEEVIRVKWDSVKTPLLAERKLKVLRFAISRGYSYPQVKKVLDSLEVSWDEDSKG